MTDKPTPTDTPPPCDQELFDQGVSVGLFDIPKWTAEALCRGIAAATEARVDWHYIGGRVHIKALPAARAPAAQAEGRKPIETAPKDGQAILVTDGMHCYCVEWDEEFDWWTVDDNKLGPFRLRGSAPTHWMPTPAAPGPADQF